ncbi:MAG: Deoxynucleoside kinase [Parcubacteria group bacterium GW2011_GWC1_45_9]|nr:MAG: Deoxynucleoside kinase [Parcubacteria group bacterium GW2011_GWC1_45_9]
MAGVLGTGKTTAAKLISNQLGFFLVKEEFAENPFLRLFYENPKRWAFHSQLFFLQEKAKQLEKIKNLLNKKNIVQDCPLEQDYSSYAKTQKILGNMNREEFSLYEKIYCFLNGHLPQPDLIIQLDSNLPQLLKRISRRGRSFEKGISKKYLQTLAKLQNQWLAKYPKNRILRINTDKLNLAENTKDRKVFVKIIKDRISAIKK